LFFVIRQKRRDAHALLPFDNLTHGVLNPPKGGVDFVTAKAPDVFFNAAKLILLVDVRGVTFARRTPSCRSTISVMGRSSPPKDAA
jgi:hypothetical protein